MTIDELKTELIIADETIREAIESFNWLRADYHYLRKHADLLETILANHEIEFPEFYG